MVRTVPRSWSAVRTTVSGWDMTDPLVSGPRALGLGCLPDHRVVAVGGGALDGVVVAGRGGASPAVVADPDRLAVRQIGVGDPGVVALGELGAVVGTGLVTAGVRGDSGAGGGDRGGPPGGEIGGVVGGRVRNPEGRNVRCGVPQLERGLGVDAEGNDRFQPRVGDKVVET